VASKTIKGSLTFIIILTIGLALAYLGGQGGARLGTLSVFVICAIWAFCVNWIAFIPANIYKTERYYDLTGAFTNSTIILLAACLSAPLSARALIATAFVVIWAVRLGTFLFKRITADGEDKRFEKIKSNPLRFLNVWHLQALWGVLTTACAVAIVTSGDDKALGPIALIGIAIWIIGFSIEVIADRQKRAFRAVPANKGKFITTGLWSWSRHPNYFGEIMLWTGMAVLAVPILSGARWAVLISPIFVILLLTRVSGVPLLEASSDKKWGGDAAYEVYKARTSVLMLKPPKSL